MTDIPLDEEEIVHEVTVTRRGKRIHTTSEPVYLPLPPAPKHVEPIPYAPEHDSDTYSDTEGVELLPATHTRERKGPSRSVSVRTFAHIDTCRY